MENYSLENRKNVEVNSSSLAFSKYQNSIKNNGIIAYQISNSGLSANGLSIETLMQESLPLVTLKETLHLSMNEN